MAGLCQKSYLTNCWKHVRWCVLLEIRYASLHLVKPHLFLSKPSHLCSRHCQKAYILSLRPGNSINYEFRPRCHSHAFFSSMRLLFVCLRQSSPDVVCELYSSKGTSTKNFRVTSFVCWSSLWRTRTRSINHKKSLLRGSDVFNTPCTWFFSPTILCSSFVERKSVRNWTPRVRNAAYERQ